MPVTPMFATLYVFDLTEDGLTPVGKTAPLVVPVPTSFSAEIFIVVFERPTPCDDEFLEEFFEGLFELSTFERVFKLPAFKKTVI